MESAFGECEFDPTEGASKNGSLGALGRLPTSKFWTKGCARRTRNGIAGEDVTSLLKMGSGTLEGMSSNPRTYAECLASVARFIGNALPL